LTAAVDFTVRTSARHCTENKQRNLARWKPLKEALRTLWFPFVLVPFLLHIFFSPAINGNQAILDRLLTGEVIAVVASSSFEWHVTNVQQNIVFFGPLS
jgi:hypothetical protein